MLRVDCTNGKSYKTFLDLNLMIMYEVWNYTYLSLDMTSIHSLPILTTGQDFLHSCLHRFGLHLSVETIAILVSLDCSSCTFFFGPILNSEK